jgi:hypothetical protein
MGDVNDNGSAPEAQRLYGVQAALCSPPWPVPKCCLLNRAFEKCSPERCALLLERVGLNRQYTTYVVHGSRIGTSAFRKGALFRAPSVQ